MAKKILAADDESPILGLVEATLGYDPRFELAIAIDGEEALAACRQNKPDLLFLDMLMPRKDGLAVCRELKASPEMQDIIIVMLTALTQDSDRSMAMAAGADDFMTKPFSPAALQSKAEEMLAL